MQMVHAAPSNNLPAVLVGSARFGEVADSLVQLIWRETGFVNKLAVLAEQVRAAGETPALDVEDMRERLGHLGEAQRLITALAPYETVVRAFLAFIAHQGHAPSQ